jgi:hypothetical protein
VANSNTYQESVLMPWRELNDAVAELNASGRVERAFEVPGRGTP